MNMSHFLEEMAEQILIRYQVKGMIAQLLFYAILSQLCRDHMGATHSPFYYFEKWCRHLLVEQ